MLKGNGETLKCDRVLEGEEEAVNNNGKYFIGRWPLAYDG